MLYQTLRLVSGVALRWYYREVSIVGAERISPTRPLLVVVNHPNALVDALVVGWLLPRPVRITAKAVLFDNPVLGAFLRALRVVPLRRASDELARRKLGPESRAPGDVDRNRDRNAGAFRAIVDAMDEGSVVLIFPEGKSHDSPGLEPLKTGPARVALAARDANRAAGLQIVPMALVFDAKDAPRSRVLATVGTPLDVHEWSAPAAGDPAAALTQEIERRIRDVMLATPTHERLAEIHELAAHVTEILSPDAPSVAGGRSLAEEYAIAARLARGIESLESLPPALKAAASDVLARTSAFIAALRAAGVAPADAAISLRIRHGARFALREATMLLIAGPVALWGRLTHWIPFRIARHIALRNVSARDQPAMRTIVAGLGLVLACYAVMSALVWMVAGGWVAAAFLLTLPFAADVDLRYSGRLSAALRRMRTYRTLRSDPELAARLARERTVLAQAVRELDARITAFERLVVSAP